MFGGKVTIYSTHCQKNWKTRADIVRILDHYRITLPEVIGVPRLQKDVDDAIWKSVKKDYEKIQKKVFLQRYPDLWKRIRSR